MEEGRKPKVPDGGAGLSFEPTSTTRTPSSSSMIAPEPLVLQEGVFLWQLHRRALLLNDGFQKQVLSAVKQHEDREAAYNHIPAGRRDSDNTASSANVVFHRTASAETVPSRLSSVKELSGNGSPHTRLSSGLMIFRDTTSLNNLMGRKQQMLSADEEMMRTFLTNADARSSSIARDGEICSVEVTCKFQEQANPTQPVEVISAPVKTLSRMKEKLKEYSVEGAQWPLSAYILDPVRACVVCSGPKQILGVLSWFAGCGDGQRVGDGLVVCRLKNKFALPAEELKGGYRDVMVFVVYTDPESGLRIIGEIQVQDKVLHDLKSKV